MISNKSNQVHDDNNQNINDNQKKISETKDEQSMTLDKRIDESNPTSKRRSLKLIFRSTISRSSRRRCSVKKVFLTISQNSQEKTCTRFSFFNKVAGLRHRCFLPAQVFSCEFCEIVKNTLFHRTPPVAASEFQRPSGRNLTKSANFEPLLTRSSHCVFVLTNYG